MTIEPHGGTLINRMATGARRDSLLSTGKKGTVIQVTDRTVSDIYMIAIGGFSPLEGFINRKDYEAVVETMHLSSGLVFSIPITLGVEESVYRNVKEGEVCPLVDQQGITHAFLTVQDKFERDIRNEARKVYRTEDEAHPGVKKVYEAGKFCLGGPIEYVNSSPQLEFPEHTLLPAETRAEFDRHGWKSVVAFQTRNPIHRAHEYITKCALEVTDGLLIHPLVGETKGDDIPADVRMKCYRVLLDGYYPRKRVMLSVLPAAMRYAGPREAIFHAVMRKNYGCTHFIVGRDHAGVGSYYGTFDAQKIFAEIDVKAFGIEPLMFDNAFWCTVTGSMATEKTSPSSPEQRIMLSGTKVREMLKNSQVPPPEFSRPEVAKILIGWATSA